MFKAAAHEAFKLCASTLCLEDKTMTKRLLIPNYLDAATCASLIDAHKAHVNTAEVNVQGTFSGRVLYYNTVPDPRLKTFMRIVQDDVRRRLREHYGLEKELYPGATHIVVWPTGSALGDHADNAYADGSPNYVPYRDYSAVIYLNDDFEGGTFYFKTGEPARVTPQSGLLVAFSAGIEDCHGVLPITSGTRYAMPMWFTHDRSKAYPEYQ